MRPRLQTARDQLLTELGRRRASSAIELAQALDVSLPTLHRLLQETPDQVIARGKARRARYAARRPIRGQWADCPVYEVNPEGQAHQIGALSCTAPQGTCLSLPATDWPLPEESRDGWWDDLPYPLQDMRPQGYLGRQLARREHQALAVPANPAQWDDDDALHVLQQRGEDTSGSLILGDTAYARWLAQRQQTAPLLMADDIGPAYLALARQAVALGVPGSSAAGEFPKFGAWRHDEGRPTPHVLVKFSGEDDSPTVTRWADLLVCEHLALATIDTLLGPHGLRAAHSRIVQHGGRTFLEVERFDRHGWWGRSRLCSLDTVNASFMGDRATDWPTLCARLARLGLLPKEQAASAELLWWFGRLIANTDMHLGNLGLVPGPGPKHGQFQLAPAYDMLPMMYAPLAGGEVAPRDFQPPWPLPPQRPTWLLACQAARHLWQQASQDARISPGFRAICASNHQRLGELAGQV